MDRVTRRAFLQYTSAAGLGAGALMNRRPVLAAANPGKATPNEKVVVGFVGVAGRGNLLMDWFLKHEDVACGAVCDVYQPHLDAAVKKVDEVRGRKPKAYRDFRDLLEQADIDAVICATPPHWHPLITVYACEAGKDVYCEKPMCLTPAEGRAMIKAARVNHRVTQIGTQIHAGVNYHHVVDIVRSGILGKISRVHCVLGMNNAPDGIGNEPDSAPPADLDWDFWCGPAPLLPFNRTVFSEGRHRYVKELIGSWIHEMGPHIVDLPVWAMDLGVPKSAVAMGGKYATHDISTIPDTLDVVWDYEDFIMTWSNQCASSFGLEFNRGGKDSTNRQGVTFQGTSASLWATYDEMGIFIEGDRIRDDDLPPAPEKTWPDHDREFIDAVKSRDLCSCDVEYHSKVHTALNLGNIAYAAGRKVTWDPEKNEIAGDAEANALATPAYRAPWRLPA